LLLKPFTEKLLLKQQVKKHAALVKRELHVLYVLNFSPAFLYWRTAPVDLISVLNNLCRVEAYDFLGFSLAGVLALPVLVLLALESLDVLLPVLVDALLLADSVFLLSAEDA